MLSSHCVVRRMAVSRTQYTAQKASQACGYTLRSRPPIFDRRLLSTDGATCRFTSECVQKPHRRLTSNSSLQTSTIRNYSGQTNAKRKEEEEEVQSAVTPEPTQIPSSQGEPTPPPSTSSLVRPVISPSIVPFLPPSALDSPHPHAPPVATSTVREAIADYLEAERSGHVLGPGPEITNKFKILYFRAKQLFKFYWAGLKLLRTNFMDMRTLQKGRKSEGWALTRREIRFIERTQGDLVRLVPFVVLMATVEELIPLMVLYSPWMLPSATLLPSQQLRIKAGEEERRRNALLSLGKHIKDMSQAILPKDVGGLDAVELNGLCRALDLGNFAPNFWLKRRLQSRLNWIKEDDALLRQNSDLSALTIEERRIALGQRGYLALYASPEELYTNLTEWLYRTIPESASTAPGSPEKDAMVATADTTDARMLSIMFEHAVKTVETQEQGEAEKEDE